MSLTNKNNRGFTLMEAVVGTALFVVIALAAYQAYFSLFTLAAVNQYKVLALDLADEQFEIIRNLPYSSVGVTNGIPAGVIPQTQTLTRGTVAFTVTTIIRNIDLPFDGQAGSTTKNDTSPADDKLVELTINCSTCKNFSPMVVTAQIAPKNLETASTNGVLSIKAYDANGNPVSGASVHVVNSQKTPSIVVDDTTDDNGMLEIVDAATGTNAYNITVTKEGYSTDKTYPASSTNPTPANPYATVLLQQVTPISFSIDQTSTFNISSVTGTCAAVPNLGFSVVGSKDIDAAGNIPKYNVTTSTGSSGTLTLSNMEWDSYTFGLNSSSYDLAGINLLNPVALDPNTTQNVLLVTAPKKSNSLLVTVEDLSNQLPLTNANVTLSKAGYTSTQITGQGFFDQTDWSGGAGQSDYSTTTSKFWVKDASVDVSSTGDVKLLKTGSTYASSGTLQSSTFDTGTPSNFHSLIWLPSNQPVGAGANSVTIQIATSTIDTSTTTWNFVGPDGTSGSFYTSSNSTIVSGGNAQYFRYKLYLNTASATNTPDVSDVEFTYATSCTPPGQVLFQGLSAGTYTLNVTNAGYANSSTSVNVSSAWKEQLVTMHP